MGMMKEIVIFDRYQAQSFATENSERRRIEFINMLASADGGRSMARYMPYYYELAESSRRAVAAAWLQLWNDNADPKPELHLEARQLLLEFSGSADTSYTSWFQYEDVDGVATLLQLENILDILRSSGFTQETKYNWDPRRDETIVFGEKPGIASNQSNSSALAYEHAFVFADEYIFALTRRQYVDMYVEENPYYADLYKLLKTGNSEKDLFIRFQILTADDFDLLKVPEGYLDSIQVERFKDEYDEAREYFLQTKYNPIYGDNTAGEPQFQDRPTDKTYVRMSYYRSFCKLMIMITTVSNYMIKSISQTNFTPDLMSNRDLDHKLVVYTLYENLKHIPDFRKRTVLNNIERFLQLKGTDAVILMIVTIFGTSDIYLSKYDLAKRVTISKNNMVKYNLQFLRLALDETSVVRGASKNERINFETFVDYDSFIADDPTWQLTKRQAQAMPFGTTRTKYLSLEHRLRAHEDLYKSQMMLSFVLAQTGPTTSDVSVFNWNQEELLTYTTKIDAKPHNIPAMMYAAMILLKKIWGLDGLIGTSATDRFFATRFNRLRVFEDLVGLDGQALEDELATQSLNIKIWKYAIKPALVEARYRAYASLGETDSNIVPENAWGIGYYPDDSQLQEFIELPYSGASTDWTKPFLTIQESSSSIDINPQGFDSMTRSLFALDQVISEWIGNPDKNWRGWLEYCKTYNLNDQIEANRYINSESFRRSLRDFRETVFKSQIKIPASTNPWSDWRDTAAGNRIEVDDASENDAVNRYLAFDGSKTLEDHLNIVDPLLYDYVTESSDTQELRDRLGVVTDAIEATIQSASAPWRDTGNPARKYVLGSNDPRGRAAFDIILTLVSRFKSYRATLKDLGYVLIIDDPDYCSIRPASEVLDTFEEIVNDRLMLGDYPYEKCDLARRLMLSMEGFYTFQAPSVETNHGTLGADLEFIPSVFWHNAVPNLTQIQNYLQIINESGNPSSAEKPYVANGVLYLFDTNRKSVSVILMVKPSSQTLDANQYILGNAPANISAPRTVSGKTTIEIDSVEYSHPNDVVDNGIESTHYDAVNPGWYIIIATFHDQANPDIYINEKQYIRDSSAQDSFGWKSDTNGRALVFGGFYKDSGSEFPSFDGRIGVCGVTRRQLTKYERQTIFRGGWQYESSTCLPYFVIDGEIDFDPGSLDFGDVIVGLNSTLSVTLTNNRGITLTLSPTSFLTGNSDYTIEHGIADGDTVDVVNGATFAFDVVYTPSFSGKTSTDLYLYTNIEPLFMLLEGTGVTEGHLVYESSLSYSYYDYQVDSQSVAIQDITVTNTGDLPVSVSGVSLVNSSGDIQPTVNLQTYPVEVTSGSTEKIGELEIDLTGTPIDGSGSIEVRTVHDGDNSPVEITANVEVLATSSTVRITPNPIDFGNVLPNTQYVYSGTARIQTDPTNELDVEVTGISSETNRVEFSGVSFPFTMAPGDIQEVIVKFTSDPDDVGSYSEVLTLSTSNSRVTIVDGAAQANIETVDDVSYQMVNGTSFPNRLPVGEVHPEPRLLRLTAGSSNNVDVDITPPSGTSNFSPQSTSVISLSRGQSVDLNLNFHPVDFVDGSRNDDLIFNTNGTPQNFTISLTGTSNRIRMQRWIGGIQSAHFDVNSTNNPFGSGNVAKMPFLLDNRDNDYAATLQSFEIDSNAVQRTLVQADIDEFQIENSFPMTVPANGALRDLWFLTNSGGTDVDYQTAMRLITNHGNAAVENQWFRKNSFSNPDFNNAKAVDISAGHDGKGHFELSASDLNVWKTIQWRNDAAANGGVDNLQFIAVNSAMYHNLLDTEIPYTQEVVHQWPDGSGGFLILGGMSMYYNDRPLLPEYSSGGRHPNGTFWEVDQTQQHDGGNNYSDWVASENGGTITPLRIRFVKPNPPPLFMTLVTNSQLTWRLFYSFKVV